MLAIALSLGGRFFAWALELLSHVPLIAWVVLALAAWGWHGHQLEQETRANAAATQLNAAHAATVASEAARTREQALNHTVQEISDDLLKTQAERDIAARNASNRMRQLADAERARAGAASALASCRSYDGPAVAVLSDAARDGLVDIAIDADKVADGLRACQAYIARVVQPTQNN